MKKKKVKKTDIERRLEAAEATIRRLEAANADGPPVQACQEVPPWSCEHANEVPCSCPCEPGCYCKTRSCKNR